MKFKKLALWASLLLAPVLAKADITGIFTLPGGDVNSVQFNDRGLFGGNSGLTYDATSYSLGIGTQTATQNRFVSDADGDLWILSNASYTASTGLFYRINIAKPAWGIEMQGSGLFPGEIDSGWVVWRAAPGANPINATFGAVGGWELGFDVTSNRDLVVGGGSLEMDGFGSFPYGRLIHSTLSGSAKTGVGRNIYNAFSAHDSSAYPDMFVGFSSDTFVVQYGTAQAVPNLFNLMVISTGTPPRVSTGTVAINRLLWSDGTISTSATGGGIGGGGGGSSGPISISTFTSGISTSAILNAFLTGGRQANATMNIDSATINGFFQLIQSSNTVGARTNILTFASTNYATTFGTNKVNETYIHYNSPDPATSTKSLYVYASTAPFDQDIVLIDDGFSSSHVARKPGDSYLLVQAGATPLTGSASLVTGSGDTLGIQQGVVRVQNQSSYGMTLDSIGTDLMDIRVSSLVNVSGGLILDGNWNPTSNYLHRLVFGFQTPTINYHSMLRDTYIGTNTGLEFKVTKTGTLETVEPATRLTLQSNCSDCTAIFEDSLLLNKTNSNGSIRFRDSTTGNYVGLTASNTVTSTNTYVLMAASAPAGRPIITDGNNNLSFGSFITISTLTVTSSATVQNLSVKGTLNVTGATTATGLITANGGVNGAHNGTVGATTPNTGVFTTLKLSGGSPNGDIVYGVYTPTANTLVNLDTVTISVTSAQYLQVANSITVSGTFTADVSSAATTTSFHLTLPVATGFDQVYDAAGVAFCGNIAGMGAAITADAITTTDAKVTWISSDITSQTWSWHLTYRIQPAI